MWYSVGQYKIAQKMTAPVSLLMQRICILIYVWKSCYCPCANFGLSAYENALNVSENVFVVEHFCSRRKKELRID
jgi:hypothetical protein